MTDTDTFHDLVRDTLARATVPSGGQAPAGAVICLCAAWCGVCRDYQALFDAMAKEHPNLAFRWLDVEDEADALDDLDIETFPTLVVSDGQNLLHAGPMPPLASHLQKLLQRVGR